MHHDMDRRQEQTNNTKAETYTPSPTIIQVVELRPKNCKTQSLQDNASQRYHKKSDHSNYRRHEQARKVKAEAYTPDPLSN